MSHLYLDHFNFQVNGETKRATYVIKDVDERKSGGEREEKRPRIVVYLAIVTSTFVWIIGAYIHNKCSHEVMFAHGV